MLKQIKFSVELRSRLRSDEGSITIESSMVMPAVFFTLMIMLLFSMYVYQKVVIYHTASISAERAAFRWDNSYRDAASGMGITGQYDGLYWRMSDDGALHSLFGLGSDNENGEMVVSVGSSGSSGSGSSEIEEDGASAVSLPKVKMSSIAGRIPSFYEGQMKYAHGFVEKRVEVKLRKPMTILPLEWMLGHSEPAGRSSAAVVDPVEFIRNVDLVRYYTAKFGQGTSGGPKRAQAAQILQERKVK
ncbi:hypothetical protein PAECIP111893_00232 [Paenibacillus plantiphilus]|uniref:TadE-like protein n=1 Tax=Paenibacillus plantiphilus TaxID=2905650 RepID=A0ABM9BNY8_9BACL|nr:TadE family protein [Paenibacillus plantiphilus]CAH1190214.1 hypothetical protein PAECIP111893_00232 [Paenibacillus plantiphilus]